MEILLHKTKLTLEAGIFKSKNFKITASFTHEQKPAVFSHKIKFSFESFLKPSRIIQYKNGDIGGSPRAGMTIL